MLRLNDKDITEAGTQAAKGAARFEESAFFEKLIAMRTTRPTDFAVMSPASKLALGYYEAAKRQAALLAEGSSAAALNGKADDDR